MSHPSDFSLSQLVDGELDAELREEVARHVEACDDCRARVRFFEELRSTTRALDFENVPVPDVADAVIRRRRAGERGHPAGVGTPGRTVTPAHATPAPRRRYAQAAAAVVIGVAGLSMYLLLAPTATATRGELTFGAVTDVPGTVPVDYMPAFYLADEDSLRLRARVYPASEGRWGAPPGSLREVTLTRRRDGRFEGRLPIEPGEVFAVAAVEDFDGVDLDTNGGRLWDLSASRGEEEPSFATLESQFRTLEAYNPVLATEWAEQLTDRYPASPIGWVLSYRQRATFGPKPMPDSVRSVYRAKLDELIQAAGADASPAEVAWLAIYARYMEEPGVNDSLLARLADLDPDHQAVVDRKIVDAAGSARFGSPELLARFEALWEAEGRSSELLIHSGVHNAAAAGRQEVLATWIDRGLAHDRVSAMGLVSDLASYPGAVDQRIRLLERRLAELEAGGTEERALRSSVPEHEAARRDEIASVRVHLAQALHEAGRDSAAIALYREAAGSLWRAEDLEPYATFLLASGDTAAAMPFLGMLAADPLEGDRALADYGAVIRSRTDDATAFVQRSRDELARRTLRGLPPRSVLRGDTRVTVASGRETTAAEYFSGRPNVLLLWDPSFPGGSAGVTTFESLSGQAFADDIRAVVVLTRPPTTDSYALPGGVPVVVDSRQELRRQVREFAIPRFVVLDSSLRVVAASSDPTDAFRIATALLRGDRTDGERATAD